jgi:DNA repair protein RecO (recombination protein O)
MAVHTSEAVVLRTWPVHEADLIVSFFTRDYGRMKGIAKSALKSRRRFGGALEPMTLARAWFAEKPRQELVRLDQLEILRSPLSAPVDVARMAVLSFFAEVLDESLPEHDPQAAVFRLLVSVLEQTAAVHSHAEHSHPDRAHPVQASPNQSNVAQPWMALTYFSLWMTRLMGLLPDIGHCIVCGEALQATAEAGTAVLKGHGFSRAVSGESLPGALAPGENSMPEETAYERPTGVFFTPHADGLFCALHRNGSGHALSADSWQLAQRMLRAPVAAFAGEPWPRRRGQDLRRFTVQALERHLERKLRTAEALGRLGS